MVRLRLRDLRDGREYEFATGPVVLGRSADCDLVVGGSGRELVSGTHARLMLRGEGWEVEEAGGRNGTFVDGRRVRAGQALSLEHGQTLGLGELGPKFTIELDRGVSAPSVAEPDDATLPLSVYEPPPPPPPPEPDPAAAPTLAVSLARVPTGDRLEATGRLLKVGRGEECDLRLVGEKIVSRVHCEIAIGPDGSAVLRDAQSRNGTRLDGAPVTGEVPLAVGQRIQLGPQGPELLVDELVVTAPQRTATPEPFTPPSRAAHTPAPRSPSVSPPRVAPTPPPHQPAPAPAPPPSEPAVPAARGPRRSFGGVGRTVFVRNLLQESEQKHASRIRTLVWTFVGVLVIAASGLLWFGERRARGTEAELAAQREALAAARAANDSARAAAVANYQDLEIQLQQARAGSAPAAVVDSLRTALEDARTHTASLEVALNRARSEMERQLGAGDSLRRATQQETERLRQVLAQSRAGGVSSAQLDSLRRAMQAAEQRAATLESGLRAVRGADLAKIAEANQAAVGLVTSFAGEDIFDGSGFVVTKSGYFVTNRHVAMPEGRMADSIQITMADQRTGYRVRLVQAGDASGPDLAVLYIPKYVGPYVPNVDWDAQHARQGEPAALIGFPAGVAAALDNTRTVRTSMSAGIFSKITPTTIQFDGFTVGGSSGSPVFNADGEVVAVHARGLVEAAGLGFAVPIRLVLPLLPEEVRREVGH